MGDGMAYAVLTVARALGRFPAEVREMSVADFNAMCAFLEIEAEAARRG